MHLVVLLLAVSATHALTLRVDANRSDGVTLPSEWSVDSEEIDVTVAKDAKWDDAQIVDIDPLVGWKFPLWWLTRHIVRCPKASVSQLVYETDDGECFPVTHRKIRIRTQKYIRFYCNDVRGFYWNNQGIVNLRLNPIKRDL